MILTDFYCLGPVVGAVLNRIHSHEHVIATGILISEPSLKGRPGDRLSFGDSLNRVATKSSFVALAERLHYILRDGGL